MPTATAPQPTKEMQPTSIRLTEAPADTKKPFWREAMAPYAQANVWSSAWNILTSAGAYIGMFALMYWSLDVSYFLTLLLAVPTAGFMLRTYIVFHDCTHGSFMPTKRANEIVGTAVGLLVFGNFLAWKHNHAIHHATAGDLDRRGIGDVECKTVREYKAMSEAERKKYRLYRNPWAMFGIGPFISLIISPRLVPKDARPRIRRSVLLTNIALFLLIVGVCILIGPVAYLMIQIPAIWLAGAIGIWLFYVQHQFEDVYWANADEWTYADAALQGCSYLKLPKVLQFFSGNIGLHHVHHLSARIPNYNLQRAHDENPIFHTVPTLTLMDGMRAVKLKLYDEDAKKMVRYDDVDLMG